MAVSAMHTDHLHSCLAYVGIHCEKVKRFIDIRTRYFDVRDGSEVKLLLGSELYGVDTCNRRQ